MYEFSDMAEVGRRWNNWQIAKMVLFVVRLAREPGKRESRYMHLFCGEVDADQPAVMDMSAVDGDLQARVEVLKSKWQN